MSFILNFKINYNGIKFYNNYYEDEIYKYIEYSFAVIGIISYLITCLIFGLY